MRVPGVYQPFSFPVTAGIVQYWIDFRHLYSRANHPVRKDHNAVLNGIAFEPDKRRLFITGKRWDTMYEVRLPKHPPAEKKSTT